MMVNMTMKLFIPLVLSYFCEMKAFQKSFLYSKNQQRNSIHVSSSSFIRMSTNPDPTSGSYLTQLQKALLVRANTAPKEFISSSAAFSTPASAPIKSPQQLQPTITSAVVEDVEDDNENGLPFSDAIYDDMKFVISKLSDRLKYNIVLSKKDFIRFEKSVQSIIVDARKKANIPITNTNIPVASQASTPKQSYTPPARLNNQSKDNKPAVKSSPPPATSTTATKKGEVEPAVAFNSLKGKQSTWHMEGMENMTTEEYYDALNKRNSAIREQLKTTSGSERNSGGNYIDSLSDKSAQTSTPASGRSYAQSPANAQPSRSNAQSKENNPLSSSPPVTTTPKKGGVEPDVAFNSLKGKQSTWHMEGMENMTTEEYYDALNKRNSAIREQLKTTSGSERNSGGNYIDSLSQKTAESKNF